MSANVDGAPAEIQQCSELGEAARRKLSRGDAPTAWAPLRYRAFRALFFAQLCSNIGSMMQNVAAAWLMGNLGGSAVFLGLVQAATYLPVLVIGLPAGALADIVNRRLLLISTQLGSMLCCVLLVVMSAGHALTPGSLLALTLGIGTLTALTNPAWQAIQPDLVPRSLLAPAVALGSLTFNAGRAIGPAVGGLALAALPAHWIFALNAVSFTGVACVLFLWRSPPAPTATIPRETLLDATRTAFRYGWHDPVLRALFTRVAMLGVPVAALPALLPLVVRDSLGHGALTYGLMLGLFGAGAASAATFQTAIRRRWTDDQILAVGSLMMAGALLVNAFVPHVVAVGAAMFVGGAGWCTAFTTLNHACLSTLAEWIRARGVGLYLLVLTGGVGLGSVLFGVVAATSLTAANAVPAIFVLATLPVVSRLRINAAHGMDLRPMPVRPPVTAHEPELSSGPILVTVAYKVRPENADRFTTAMQATEKYRRRTGAVQWSLYRDLADQERFLETFLVASWGDHLRQHQRLTVSADATLAAARCFVDGKEEVAHLLGVTPARVRRSARRRPPREPGP